MEENIHEVTQLVKNIQLECQILWTALDELAEGSDKYRFLANCLQKRLEYQSALVPLVGEERAQLLVAQAIKEA